MLLFWIYFPGFLLEGWRELFLKGVNLSVEYPKQYYFGEIEKSRYFFFSKQIIVLDLFSRFSFGRMERIVLKGVNFEGFYRGQSLG